MAKKHFVTEVLLSDEKSTEAKLAAVYDDENEIISIELKNKEIFRMDVENFKEWATLVIKNN